LRVLQFETVTLIAGADAAAMALSGMPGVAAVKRWQAGVAGTV